MNTAKDPGIRCPHRRRVRAIERQRRYHRFLVAVDGERDPWWYWPLTHPPVRLRKGAK